MKVAITQPNFLPWSGYFACLSEVDKFIFLDTASYGSKPKRMNRNSINNHDGNVQFISLQISGSTFDKKLHEIKLVTKCFVEHLKLIKNFYLKAPYFKEVYELIEEMYDFKGNNLSEFNINSIKLFSNYFGYKPEFLICSKDFPPKLDNTQDYMIDILTEIGAKNFFTFKNGVLNGIYDINKFTNNKIKFFVQDFKDLTYNRPNFKLNMSIIDLMFYDLPNVQYRLNLSNKFNLLN